MEWMNLTAYMDDQSLTRLANTCRLVGERIRDCDLIWWERFRAQREYWRIHLPPLSDVYWNNRTRWTRDVEEADRHWDVVKCNWQFLSTYISWRERYRIYSSVASNMTLEYAVIETSSQSPVPRVVAWMQSLACEDGVEKSNADVGVVTGGEADHDRVQHLRRCRSHWVYRKESDVAGGGGGGGGGGEEDSTTTDDDKSYEYGDALRRAVYSFVERSDTVHCIHAVVIYFGDRKAAERRCVEDHTRALIHRREDSIPISASSFSSETSHHSLRYFCVHHVVAVFLENSMSLDSNILYYRWNKSGQKEILHGKVSLEKHDSLHNYYNSVAHALECAAKLEIVNTDRVHSSYLIDPITFTPLMTIASDHTSIVGLVATKMDDLTSCTDCHIRLPPTAFPSSSLPSSSSPLCYNCTWLPRLSSSSFSSSSSSSSSLRVSSTSPPPPPSPTPSTLLVTQKTKEWKGKLGGYPEWYMCSVFMYPSYLHDSTDAIDEILRRLCHSRSITNTDEHHSFHVKRPRPSPP